MKSSEISKLIADREQLLAKVQASHAGHGQRIADAEGERQKLFVAARAKGDSGAQAKIRELAAQIEDVKREQSEDAAAVELIGAELAELRGHLSVASKMEARAQLKQFIAQKSALNRAARIVELIRSLQAELEAFDTDRDEIVAQVRAYDPELENIASSASRLSEPVLLEFGALNIPVNQYLENWAIRGGKLFDQVVQALEARLLPGEPLPADRHAYRAKDGANFGMYGLSLHGGELVYLSPEHAADYVKAGLLQEQTEEAAPAAV